MVTDVGALKIDTQLVTKASATVIPVISCSGVADTHREYKSMIVRIYLYPESEGNGPTTSRLMSLNLSLADGILMIAGLLCRVTWPFDIIYKTLPTGRPFRTMLPCHPNYSTVITSEKYKLFYLAGGAGVTYRISHCWQVSEFN